MANFKETQIANFTIGQAVSIDVDTFPYEKFSGVIESLSPATGSRYSLLPPDNATGNFVKIIQRIPVRIKQVKHERKRMTVCFICKSRLFLLSIYQWECSFQYRHSCYIINNQSPLSMQPPPDIQDARK